MSTDLTQTQSNLPATLDDSGFSGFGDISQVSPAQIKLLQPTSPDIPENGKPGQFYNKLTDEVSDRLTMVILRVTSPRTYFTPGAPFGSDPICKSLDGVAPLLDSKLKQSNSCATCPKGKFHGNTKPECIESRQYLAVDRKTGLPFYFQVAKKALADFAKPLNLKMTTKIAMAQKAGEDFVRSYHFEVVVKAVKPSPKDGKPSSYYVPQVVSIERIPNDEAATYGVYVQKMMAAKLTSKQGMAEAVADAAVTEVIEGEIITEV